MKRMLLFLPLLALAFTADDGAKTILTDGTESDTEAAIAYIDSKNQSGWVLTVGSAGGSYSWGAVAVTLTNTQPWTFQGASSNNRPTITVSAVCAITGRGSNGTVTVKDIKWRGTGSLDDLLTLNGTALQTRNYRMVNCNLANTTGGLRDMTANAYGLIDHCQFEDTGATASIYCNNAGVGNSGWDGVMSFGTEETVCIEDCWWSNDYPDPGTVVQKQAIDGIDGFRVCIRFNTFTNCQTETHGETSGVGHEGLQVEGYNNAFYYIGSGEDAADTVGHIWRGGTGIWASNTVTFQGGFWDGTTPIARFRAEQAAAYLADHQPGTGLVSNDTIGRVPIYFWSNSVSGTLLTDANTGRWVTQEGTMVVNTDYYRVTIKPGYTTLAYPHPLISGESGGGGSSGNRAATVSGTFRAY